ncbi:RNA polymerase II transcription factor B 52 kDa subunit [Pichia californica]|uniref:RNA polymerase II transcription factor B subunit 2 n=1 Tax=Pichia californica TaxID=460514 RepID=A0A9P6WK12_9ASCO|nr:RNA polymerase II transcription factor B 52 kDa subunit [[Candida] californica]
MSTPQPPSSSSLDTEESVDFFKSTINEYLDNLPESVHQELFQSRETCLAIFRLLPALSKFYIMALLFHETSAPYSDLNRWVKSNKSSEFKGHQNPTKIYQNDSIKRLKSLHILKEIKRQMVHPITKQPTIIIFVQLNEIFRQSLRDALTGFLPDSTQDQSKISLASVNNSNKGKSNDLNSMFEDDIDNDITIEYLDRYCLAKWENILHFMVGTEIKEIPSVGVLTLLRFSGLMELPSDREHREALNGMIDDTIDNNYEEDNKKSIHTLRQLLITRTGFQFLLQEISSQIWTLLIQYLIMAEKLKMNPVDVLNFIFLLGSLELGQGYAISMLSKTQLIMLDHLQDYGLIYHQKNSSVFYPTRLATSLTSESSSFKTASNAIDQEISQPRADKETNSGAIIIETNFKIYCYTSSPLQIAILNLFVHLRARFSNMVTGVVTRDSVRSALRNGISSAQIINYLETHAHSGMIELAEAEYNKKYEFESSIGNMSALEQLKLEILPPTVIDQIKLWQLELDRVQSFKGYLYKDFNNDFEFEKLLSYGEDIGIIIWKDKVKRKFFVSQEGNPQLIDYANKIIRNSSNTPRANTPA